VDGGWGPMGLWVEAFSLGEVAGLWSMGLACLKGTGQRSGAPVCLDRLGGVVEQNGDPVVVGCWLGRP
jgi:hypothetical protein